VEGGVSGGDEFMQAFVAGTDPHPFTHVLRVWNGCAVFEVKQLRPELWGGASVRLSFVQSLERGRGDGSRALDWFLDLARQHGVTVVGDVQRVGTEGLKVRELRAWYKRHGFRVARTGALRFDG
jgi:GNAT superfamily N-acetyltransferase